MNTGHVRPELAQVIPLRVKFRGNPPKQSLEGLEDVICAAAGAISASLVRQMVMKAGRRLLSKLEACSEGQERKRRQV